MNWKCSASGPIKPITPNCWSFWSITPNTYESALDRLFTLLVCAEADRLRIILFGTPEAQQRLKQTFGQK